MLYVGIDVAKRSHTAAAVGEHGCVVVAPFRFDSTAAGFTKLLKRLSENGVVPFSAAVGMEATGHYWISLFDFLVRQGFEVSVINPLQTDAFRRVETVRKTKTDSTDALQIAELMRFKTFEPSALGDETIQAMQQLSRYRSYLVEERTSLKNKLAALIDLVFPEYSSLFSDMFCATSLEVLKGFGTPKELLATSVATIEKTLCSFSCGRIGKDRAKALRAAAASSVGVSFRSDAMAFEIKLVVENIQFLGSQIKDLEDELERLLGKSAGRWLTTIPGIGVVLASAIASEIGDAKRFETPRKLIAYAGMDATKRQSGESDPKGHMSKRGCPHLRCSLMRAADTVRRFDPYFKDHYEMKIAEGKHHYVALSGVARKLAEVILALMKEQRAYEPVPPPHHRPSTVMSEK